MNGQINFMGLLIDTYGTGRARVEQSYIDSISELIRAEDVGKHFLKVEGGSYIAFSEAGDLSRYGKYPRASIVRELSGRAVTYGPAFIIAEDPDTGEYRSLTSGDIESLKAHVFQMIAEYGKDGQPVTSDFLEI